MTEIEDNEVDHTIEAAIAGTDQGAEIVAVVTRGIKTVTVVIGVDRDHQTGGTPRRKSRWMRMLTRTDHRRCEPRFS